MVTALFFLFLGIIILYYSGDFLIKGSKMLALKYGLDPFFVGATIVALGTSAPEFFVSLISTLKGFHSIASGNVIGSNIANIALVLGLALFFTNKKLTFKLPKMEFYFFIFGSFSILLFVFAGKLPRLSGIILLAVFTTYLFYTIKNRNSKETNEEKELKIEAEKDKKIKLYKIIFFIIIGIIGLPFGADLFVKAGVKLGTLFGVSELLIGVTVVALGTSLPELVASIIAIIKKDTQMSLGNVLGSNIFNTFGVLGSVSVVSPIQFSKNLYFEAILLVFISLSILFLRSKKQNYKRYYGLLLVLIYVFYTTTVLFRG